MEADSVLRNRILEMVPQQRPFRFISEIRELDEEHIVGAHRFSEDEYFYQGHFPGFPVTPGVILIETMAQTGVVAFGIYLQMLREKAEKPLADLIALFTFADAVEFTDIVRPGETVSVFAKKLYFRGNQLKSECIMTRKDGSPVCSGLLTGRAVPQEKVLSDTRL
jgi:3-hydroxyacyl-[acyl-carrier-protein] dehydratase